MKIRHLAVLSLLLVFSTAARGQTVAAGITAEYDRFKDTTNVVWEGTTISSNADGIVVLSLISAYNGKVPPKEPLIMMLLTSASRDWRFSRAPSLTLRAILDDKRLEYGDMLRANIKEQTGSVSEQLALYFPVSKLVRIVNAGKVEMQLADLEFELTKTQREHIREFLTVLNVPTAIAS
jgi:hypothetical protein